MRHTKGLRLDTYLLLEQLPSSAYMTTTAVAMIYTMNFTSARGVFVATTGRARGFHLISEREVAADAVTQFRPVDRYAGGKSDVGFVRNSTRIEPARVFAPRIIRLTSRNTLSSANQIIRNLINSR